MLGSKMRASRVCQVGLDEVLTSHPSASRALALIYGSLHKEYAYQVPPCMRLAIRVFGVLVRELESRHTVSDVQITFLSFVFNR